MLKKKHRTTEYCCLCGVITQYIVVYEYDTEFYGTKFTQVCN